MRWPSDLVLAREGRTGDLQPQAPWLALHWLLTPLAGAWKLPGSRRVLGSGVAAAGLPLPPGAQGAQKRPGSCSSSGPELPASWPGTLGTPQHPSGPRDLTHSPLRFAGPGATANRGCAIARPPGPANSRPTFPESGRPHALPPPAPAQTLTHSAWGASDTRPATRLRSGFPVHCRLSVSPFLFRECPGWGCHRCQPCWTPQHQCSRVHAPGRPTRCPPSPCPWMTARAPARAPVGTSALTIHHILAVMS